VRIIPHLLRRIRTESNRHDLPNIASSCHIPIEMKPLIGTAKSFVIGFLRGQKFHSFTDKKAREKEPVHHRVSSMPSHHDSADEEDSGGESDQQEAETPPVETQASTVAPGRARSNNERSPSRLITAH